jgi:hypothetical protein
LARYLALDWDHQQLHVVAATVSGSTVKIQRAAVWREAQSPNLANAEELGRLLKARLQEAGIGPAPVLACIGRDRVIVKEVRHPPVPPAEEAALVHFQAAKELTGAAEEVVIDYTAAGDPAPNGERRELVLIARRELVTAYDNLCKAAGLKLAAVTPRAFGVFMSLKRQAGVASLAPVPAPADGPAALLTVSEGWAEFCVAAGGSLVFARTLAAGPGLPGEVRRNLAVYSGQAPQQPARALYVADGGEHAVLRERLQGVLGVPVHPFDPFAGVTGADLPAASRGAFAGAAGLLYAQAARQPLPINFVAPKQPKPPGDPNQRLKNYVAAGVAAAVLALAGYCFLDLRTKSKEIENLNLVLRGLDAQTAPLEDDAKQIKAVGDWLGGEVVWLDELYDMVHRLEGAGESLRLTDFEGSLNRGARHVAQLKVSGTLRDDRAVQALQAKLNEDSQFYRINHMQMSSSRGGSEQKFVLPLDIVKRQPPDYLRVLTAEEGKDRPRGRGGFPQRPRGGN